MIYRAESATPQTPSALNNAQRLADFRQRVRGFEQLISFVRRADHRPQPRFAFGDDRVTDGGRKYSGLKKLLRKLERLCRFAYMNRNDRRLAGFELESALLQFALEELRVGPELFHQFLPFG